MHNDGLDFKSASAGPDAIVIEQFGASSSSISNTHQGKNIPIHVAGDIAAVRPHFAKVSQAHSNFGISPTGARAVFEARGEIFTVPAEKGDVATSRAVPLWPSAIPHGRPTGNRSPTFPMSPANTPRTSAIRTAWRGGQITLAIRRLLLLADVVARQQEDCLFR